MCASMVDIQSATAEIRLGKKEERNKPQDENIGQTIIKQLAMTKKFVVAFTSHKAKKDWGKSILSPLYLEKYWGECPHCPYGVSAADYGDHSKWKKLIKNTGHSHKDEE